MPTLSAYANGLTMGTAGPGGSPGKRGAITGWSPAAVRRHKRWLYSVQTPALTGQGYALTLTLRETPGSATEWHRLRRVWIDRLRRRGLVRLHWVVEWQRRGTPHLHCAVYFPEPLSVPDRVQLVTDWVDVTAGYGTLHAGQVCKPIDGALGWLQYLSKHAARGVAHYQRQGKPAGWETSGRLWGHNGEWPTEDAIRVDIDWPTFYRYRRLVRSWRVADARRAGDRRRIRSARRMLRCADPNLSRVRGVSEFIPEDQGLLLLAVADATSDHAQAPAA